MLLVYIYRLAVDIVHLVVLERQNVFDPKQAVRHRCAAEVLRPVRLRRVAHPLEKLDLLCVQRRRRVRKSAQVQREVVVGLAVLGLFGAVERRVVRVDPVGGGSPGVHEVDVRRARAVVYVVVERDYLRKSVAEQFEQYEHAEDSLHSAVEPVVVYARQEYHVYRDAGNREPDAQKVGDVLVFELLDYDNEQSERGSDSEHTADVELLDMLEGEVRRQYNDEAEYKAVAVIQPVRSLEAVPDKVDCRRVEAEHIKADYRAERQFAAGGYLLYQKEHRQEYQRQRARVDERPALRTHRVVRRGVHFCDEVEKVEFLTEVEVRVGEGRLAEGQRVVGRQYDYSRDSDRYSREERHAGKGLDEMRALTERVAFGGRVHTVGKEEVSRDRDADHIADVVVREHRDGEDYHIQLVAAVFYQRVDSKEDERQEQ